MVIYFKDFLHNIAGKSNFYFKHFSNEKFKVSLVNCSGTGKWEMLKILISDSYSPFMSWLIRLFSVDYETSKPLGSRRNEKLHKGLIMCFPCSNLIKEEILAITLILLTGFFAQSFYMDFFAQPL